MRLFVLVPCRNEERVLARKLENLRTIAWPQAPAPHRIVIVDDGSTDRTHALAGGFAAGFRADVELRVLHNTQRAGKPGAMRCGLELLEPGFDLVVLSDADVELGESALVALTAAFERDARLGMASGAQRFVAADGVSDDSAAWDRWTARVRLLESHLGALYSVHGQLLAWRAQLGLEPRLGIAADDIALALDVRARGLRVELVHGAQFLERKTPPGPDADAQALRRARAYLQVVRAVRPDMPDWLGRLQCLLYRELPPMAPALTWIMIAVLALLPAALLEGWWRASGLVGIVLALSSAPGRRWLGLMGIIARARSEERRATLAESWEMTRP